MHTQNRGTRMNKAPHTKRWFSGWWGAGRVQHDDFADMGTAFGLDQSMEASTQASDTPRDEVLKRPVASWVKRLTLRRRVVA